MFVDFYAKAGNYASCRLNWGIPKQRYSAVGCPFLTRPETNHWLTVVPLLLGLLILKAGGERVICLDHWLCGGLS